MKIGLFGIRGVYNFGCEAIVRGAYEFIKDMWPNAHITYFSYNYEYDKQILDDLNIEIKEVQQRKKTIFLKVLNKISILLRKEKRVLYFKYKEIIDSVDVIMSIGGDIYTIPAVFRQNRKYDYYNYVIDFCDRVIVEGKKVILYGASVGPFGDYSKAIDYYSNKLKKYKAIICREKSSVDYLRSIGVENICFCPDPAFLVKQSNSLSGEKRYIGVNLSPLSFRELYGEIDDKTIEKIAVMLEKIIEEVGVELLFIPHVISKDVNDNDEQFLKVIFNKLKENSKKHVKFASVTGGFLGIKRQLEECYCIFSARMHCGINAIVQNVPVIFLAYSQKSIGMCEYIYGNDKWCIKLEEFENVLPMLLMHMWEMKEEVSNSLRIRNYEITREYTDKRAEVYSILVDNI